MELSAGLLGGTQPVICYRRGRDKPPLVELGCVAPCMGTGRPRGRCIYLVLPWRWVPSFQPRVLFPGL